jgi:pimeloyl-ACP methyl ester carboxylesterase
MRTRLLAATAALFLANSAFAKPAVPTVEQLAAYPKMSGAALSPDGKHLALLEGRGEDRVILVFKTDALGEKPTVIGATSMKIQQVFFVKDDVLGVALWQPYDFRGEEVTKTFVGKFFLTDLEGRNWREPLQLPRAKTAEEEQAQSRTSPSLLNILPNDPDHILVVNNVGVDAGDVFKINVRTGRNERVQRSDDKVSGYVPDLDGNVRARLKGDIDGGGAFVAAQFRSATGAWEEHFRSYVKARDVVQVIGFTEDPNVALILSNVGRDKNEIYEYDIAARKKLAPLFSHKLFEASGVVQYPFRNSATMKFGELIGLRYDGPSGDEIVWVAPQFQALDKAIKAALNITEVPTVVADSATGATAKIPLPLDGKHYSILDYTSDLKTVIISVSGPTTPPVTYLLRDGKLTTLAKSRPDIDPTALGSTTLVSYPARDGLTIPAFLTTPSAALCGAGPYRSVVHPHGGPWGRDTMGWDGSSWVNLMATRCIAVLRPQFRGSQGWGRRLWLAGDGEWGQKMQDDKDDGAKWMVAQNIAIPGRIAMFGFSYGGYSAMAAAIRPNGIYRCAIAGAGVSDIKRIARRFYTSRFYSDAQGPTIKGLNPVEKADTISIPILVYQGERDQTVPQEQSEWYVAKARKSSQRVDYKLFADYAHGPAWTRAIEADQLRLIDDYFSKGCGGSGL